MGRSVCKLTGMVRRNRSQPAEVSAAAASPYAAATAFMDHARAVTDELRFYTAERDVKAKRLGQITAEANELKAAGRRREGQRLLKNEGLPLKNEVTALIDRVDSLTAEANRLVALMDDADLEDEPDVE